MEIKECHLQSLYTFLARDRLDGPVVFHHLVYRRLDHVCARDLAEHGTFASLNVQNTSVFILNRRLVQWQDKRKNMGGKG